MTQKQIDRKVRQRNALSEFMKNHSKDYSLQINFGAVGSPDHCVVSVSHDSVEAFHQLVIQYLGQ